MSAASAEEGADRGKDRPPGLHGSTGEQPSRRVLEEEIAILREENSKLKEKLRTAEARNLSVHANANSSRSGSFDAGVNRTSHDSEGPSFGILSRLEIPYDSLDIREQVGGGGFSVVYRALWMGTPVVVKKWFDPSMGEEAMQDFRAEMMTLSELRHPHIVLLLGACTRPPDLCLVLEYVPHTLHYILHKSNIVLDRKRIISLAIDLTKAMLYLHAQRPPLIHRDLKPANLLVDRQWRVKLCDFGLASTHPIKKGAGTPAYMARELLAGKPYNERVDVYSFGIVLWEMMAREVPFDGLDYADICKKVVEEKKRPPIPLSCSRAIANLIRDCWHDDPAERPTFNQIAVRLRELQYEGQSM
ncbi:hypothetical protein CBR_g18676 [Chara braunii]|uniref:Protein kinase domain-containing protein n=1 Tax=Chara braunii TaxID=69332 RepID=A0A388KW17_CHABU|nr:hypothetical protein CBR_g18676 [Chara braunii]|eukprot:GBG74265.1 hypothetical protein CBR_g18676 [Chara braunii]